MIILYFSSTGNSLYVAKKIGGKIQSIPERIEKGKYQIKDDSIGIVFPIYGLCIPPYVEAYIKKMEAECDYLFAIATYGFFPGAVCGQLKELALKNNRHFDYVNRLKMGENCITFADMAKQQGDSGKQQKEIQRILEDIRTRRKFIRRDSLFKKIMTVQHKKAYEYPTGTGITDKVSINENCAGCGICVRVCPMGNIRLENGRPFYGTDCISCGGCIQNCPKNAIHHEEEKSGARYRNPHVAVEELFLRK